MNKECQIPGVNTPPKLPTGRRWPVSPLLLTTLVYPGLGQLVQRRWVAGAVSMVAFTGAGGWFLVQAVRAMMAYYRMAFDFNGAPESVAVHPRDIVAPFVVALVVYVAAAIDTAVADARARHGVA